MADVTIEPGANTVFNVMTRRAGPYWTTPSIGYVIFLFGSLNLKYRKTTDGGANWGAATSIKANVCRAMDSWADWQTPGDGGTKIHIAYVDATEHSIRYIYLDTSDDSVGGDDEIEACQGSASIITTQGLETHNISITKTRGGNIAVAFFYTDSIGTRFYEFYTSPDADIWTKKTTIYEGQRDFVLLFPGNEADTQDVWAIFWDKSTNELSLKTFDDSGNSWGEQLISGSMEGSGFYTQMDGAIRHSDKHLILAAWSKFNDATSDLKVWDINGAGSITGKTNIITDTAEYIQCSVLIDQSTNDIYVAYLGGTDATTLVAAFYQKSTNGGAGWNGQAAMQADAEDDIRWISCGAVKVAWGGKFQPFWFDDDEDDLFTNTDNGISIDAVVVGLENKSAHIAAHLITGQAM